MVKSELQLLAMINHHYSLNAYDEDSHIGFYV